MLLRAEFRKLLPYRTVWIVLLLFAVLLTFFVSVGSNVTINGQTVGSSLYAFPGLWGKLAYVASYFHLLLGILLIILITDEFQFRTFRQQLIDGSSPANLIQGKLAVSGLLAAFGVVVVLLVGLYFGLQHADETSAPATEGLLDALLRYGVQALGYLSLAALFGFLIRKSGPAILLFLLYSWVIEPLLRLPVADHIDRYFPTKVFSTLTPNPTQVILDTMTGPTSALPTAQAIPLTLAYAGIFWLLSYLLIRYRDM
jgi:hypothetical protein